MAKSKIKIAGISEAVKNLKKGNILPLYFFFGEDSFSIDEALKAVETTVLPHVTSDFDREVFYGEEKSISDVLGFATAFPFGSDKKLLILKEFEKVKDKKNLLSYAESPADFTVMVIVHNGGIKNTDTVLYKTLAKNNFIYEAKELKGNNLVNWVVDFCEVRKKTISFENALMLVDIVGENRSMIEAQLDKILTYIADKEEISLDDVKSLSTSLKEFSIFDLQDAVSKRDKSRSLKIAYNMLEKGQEPTFIIHMLTRYFTGLARINEMTEKKMNEYAAARIIGTHPFYLKNYRFARKAFTDRDLHRASEALLKADITVKTTSSDNKSVITLLISEIMV
ncbi:MAG TPA: DNA polymerase III subunit delta [Ignavibacteriaceae bacterium]|nr:DNA polymerase III subunit delta [Ignavibacteriaceae bacterium]